MRLKDIQNRINQMVADVKTVIVENKSGFDFYTDIRALQYAKTVFEMEKYKTTLLNIDLSRMEIKDLSKIENFLITLKKEDYFTIDEIKVFLDLIRKIQLPDT